VIGPLADDRDAPLGHWRGDGRPDDVVTLLAALQERTKQRPGLTVTHAPGCTIEGDLPAGFEAAVRAARGADVAIVALGESAEMSGEAASRTTLDLPGRQLDLLQTIVATGTPTVLLLYNGRPLSVPWAAAHVPAILEAWLPGTEGGHAIADVLFGDVNPGGKLPVTFPRTVGQVPIYYNHRNTGRPPSADRYTSKYSDVPVGPLFPFGHGLSYSRFRLSSLRLSRTEIPADGLLTVDVDLENLGQRTGDEVVQLYLRDVVASVARPVRELRGFRRVALKAGEKTTVHFALLPENLGVLDARMRFVVEPGAFLVIAGTSSTGGLEARFRVTGSPPEDR
jgi:beta-glucosidase